MNTIFNIIPKVGKQIYMFGLLLLTACATVNIRSQEYLGGPIFPPTLSSHVEILRLDPVRPNIDLGQITAQPMGDPPNAEIESKLRDAAAKMGANAVVIIADRTILMGASITGGYGYRNLSRNFQRVIVAKAIRYTNLIPGT